MAQLSQLLLFDPDPSGLDTLSYGFEKDGCSVTATSDATKARELIQSASPAMVVVNFRDAEQVALDLLRATTSNPRTRNIPCVAIGRQEFRAAALGAGAFVFLAMPLFVRDVLGACRLVAAASVPGSRPSPDTELSLSMADIDAVYFLVRSMAVSGRSTAIELRHETTRGDLRFIDGTLTSAQVGAVQGLPALHRMLLWQTASLKFRFKNVVRRGSQLAMKSSEVIEECDRFLRDFAHEVKGLGFVHSVYRPNARPLSPAENLPSEVVPVLKLFDGRRDLGQILEASPFRVFDTLKIVNRFAQSGAIVATTPAPSIVPEIGPTLSGPAALDFWFQRQSFPLGAELGIARRGTAARTATQKVAAGASLAGRPSSPFVAVASGPLAATALGSSVRADLPAARARTATRKNVVEAAPPRVHDAAEDVVTPPPIVTPPRAIPSPTAVITPAPKMASTLAATMAPTMASTMAAPVMTKPLATPAPVARPANLAPQPRMPGPLPAAPVPAAAAMPVTPPPERITKPATAVATGEIKNVAPPSRVTGSVPVLGSPTVLVDIGDLPAPVSMAPPEPTPMTATAPAPAPPQSVIIAPLTPAPLLTPRPSNGPPTPGVVEAKNRHPPSDNFNALEADFFEREADLYKRESVESFDDLDKGHPKANGRKR